MSYRLGVFSSVGLDEPKVRRVLDEHERATRPKLDRLWAYYRNPLRPSGLGWGISSRSGKWYRQAQEAGLPARVTGRGVGQGAGLVDDRASGRREIVIENDIAWRVQAMVDFMFGKPLIMKSVAGNAELAATIERVLDKVWEQSGGIALLQDIGLMGHVFGHVDLVLRIDEAALLTAGDVDEAAAALRVEVIDPRRGVAIVDDRDYRNVRAYLIFSGSAESVEEPGLRGLVRALARGREREDLPGVLEVLGAGAWQVYEQGKLVWEQSRDWLGGEMPVAHIQNISQPLEYEGLGEVEPLIPLQDELNTRLSDRASRVTLQSFKMYLAKGVEGFDQVGPGQVWTTDNTQASVESFGGDASSPSEESHIREVREAMDKVSGIPPLAGGVIQARIGNLSSANALRITLMGLLAKTARKQVAYGRGIARINALVLSALDTAGVLTTRPEDRRVVLHWSDPLPQDERESVAAAEGKQRLGVPAAQVLEELGYPVGDAGVQ